MLGGGVVAGVRALTARVRAGGRVVGTVTCGVGLRGGWVMKGRVTGGVEGGAPHVMPSQRGSTCGTPRRAGLAGVERDQLLRRTIRVDR